jgi:hypothetical protein
VRTALYAGREGALIGFTHPRIRWAAALLASLHLWRQVPDTALRAALAPAYAMECNER